MEGNEVQFPSELSPAALWKMLIHNQQQMLQFQAQQLTFQQDTAKSLAKIHDIISQSKGGLRVLIVLGTTVAGATGWLFHELHIFK